MLNGGEKEVENFWEMLNYLGRGCDRTLIEFKLKTIVDEEFVMVLPVVSFNNCVYDLIHFYDLPYQSAMNRPLSVWKMRSVLVIIFGGLS